MRHGKARVRESVMRLYSQIGSDAMLPQLEEEHLVACRICELLKLSYHIELLSSFVLSEYQSLLKQSIIDSIWIISIFCFSKHE